MYWTLSQFPEIQSLEPRERAEVLRRLPRGTYFDLIVGSARFGLFAALLTGVFARVAAGIHWDSVLLAILAAMASGFRYVIHLRAIRVNMRLEIIRGFQGRRLPFCRGCGYDLRVTQGPTCPECGKTIQLGTDVPR